jgi:predicted nucleic-acid-binding protein
MIALDTNVLARYLLGDDAKQQAIATHILDGDEPVTAPITVFLELAWVLQGKGVAKDDILHAFESLLTIRYFMPEHEPELQAAIQWSYEGMDIADAIHLAMSHKAKTFKTFDKAFAKLAKEQAAHPAVNLLTTSKARL